ncbi:MAG TPA: methyl-accepting chemotaxis protein [Anaeromyxobacteraceae bacterium]|nr:methyl-accepting chemotaxis protein [Anaeromyxobacteraceae bacterium]
MPDEPSEPPSQDEAIRRIAAEGGNLGIEIVDVAGHVEDVATRLTAQARKFHGLRDSALQVLGCDRSMDDAAKAARAVAHTTGQEVQAKRQPVEVALADIRGLVDVVRTTAARLEELRRSLEEVARTAATIGGIANHTHILAINATVEAAHAGASGSGFAIIAREVRDLAQQTRDTSKKVDASLKSLATVAGQLAQASQEGTRKAEAVGVGARSIAALVDIVERATQDIEQRALTIAEGAKNVEERVGGFVSDVNEMDTGVEASSASLRIVSDRLNGLMGLAERILGLSATTGVDTFDRHYIDSALQTARVIGDLFDREIAEGRADLSTFFDERYAPIPNTNPPQFLTRFTSITDRLLPPILEPPLEADPKVVFVVAVDRNGYLPTHNRKFSQRQGSDPDWNKANCRNRRMFDDRVGLAAARNEGPFLIQCYRRDMGGGNFSLMKDSSAPIFVGGRHWGALRIGYRT